MQWLGWAIAFVALVALLLLWFRLHAQLRTERQRGSDLLCGKIELENQLDALQSQLAEKAGYVEPQVVREEFAASLDGALESLRGRMQQNRLELADYSACVRRFDAAVQYCLQPVELIVGADKASLDELVRHVEGARRQLFDARAELVAHPLHGGAPELGAAALAALEATLREASEASAAAP